jgi:hypothetical protein
LAKYNGRLSVNTELEDERRWKQVMAGDCRSLIQRFEQFAYHPISCGSIGSIRLRLSQDAAEQNLCCLASAASSTANKPPPRFCYGFVTVLCSELQGYIQPIVANQVLSDSGFGPVVLPLLHRDRQS